MLNRILRSESKPIARELFSIVFGILLALTIDEWVSDYKFKKFNQKLIDEMYLELDEDISGIDESINKINKNIEELEQYIAKVEKDPDVERTMISMFMTYNRNLFWQTVSTKADLSLLEQGAQALVSSIYRLNIMQDAVQEHYNLMRQFIFSVCEYNKNMRLSCLSQSLKQRQYLVVLLESEKAAYLNFKEEYERYIE